MAGSTSYPGGLDNFAEASPTNLGDSDTTGRNHAKRHDDVETTIEAIETELGVNPSGTDATVAARLSAIEAGTNLASGSITSAKILDATIVAGDLADNAVTTAKILDSAVTSAKILDGTIVTADLADSSVTTAKILDGTILAADLSASATAAPFGGSLLVPVPDTPAPGEQLLRQAVWWIDAQASGSSDSAASNLGWGGTALNAAQGTAANQPKFLAYAGSPYVYLPGVASNYLSVPDEAALDITNNLDLRIKVALDDWTPASSMNLFNKYDTVTQISFYLRVNPAGTLTLLASSDGTAPNTGAATSTVATGLTDGSVKWVRATFETGVCKFWLSDDGVTWTQLGANVTMSGPAVTAIFASTSTLKIGTDLSGTNTMLAAKFYRAQVLNGIGGTPVLDVDTSVIGSGAAASFTALTGQTVTVNRATSGRKSVCVVAPCWLFGTDDYLEVADNALLDFTSTDGFTAMVAVRTWGTSGNWLGKGKTDLTAGGQGYLLSYQSTRAQLSDTDRITGTVTTPTGSIYTLMMNYDGSTKKITAWSNVTAGTASTAAVGTDASNAYNLRVGRQGEIANYGDMEFVAGAIFRRALTAAEVATLSDYYLGRIGG